MRVIIEDYGYKVEDVETVLHGLDALQNVNRIVSVSYVGYYYNSKIKDCVFILPKVLLNEQNKVFGQFAPEDIINVDKFSGLSDKQKSFIYELAVWIYRAICVFNKTPNEIVYQQTIGQMGNGRKVLSNTYLDIILSIIRFSRQNQDFFMFVLKNIHSGFNKINWIKTISRSQAIIQDDSPVYLNPVNKKRKINYDDELFIIYFSILNYISQKFGFHVDINFGFQLINSQQFENYIKGFGKRRLLQIKYKYFSDKALMLWELCYAFFDKSHHIRINTEQKEYLLVKNFHIVFEAIIDELIGDRDLPAGLKEQYDGKRVDHMYKYKGLIEQHSDTPIYYIGDSKYYKMDTRIGRESIYKQWTYARNVIQWNLDIFLNGRQEPQDIKLRDDETEGYNIIPNFFISARLDEELNYDNSTITQTGKSEKFYASQQFENRLFDRDTLLVYHYDVNFLYVVSLYARERSSEKNNWKQQVRNQFRKEIQNELQKNYQFYAMTAKPDVEASRYLKENFQQVLGKIFTPFSSPEIYSLALDKSDNANNDRLLSQLRNYFYVEECELGEDPSQKLPEISSVASNISGLDDYVVIGNYHSETQKQEMLNNMEYYARLENINLGLGAYLAKYLLLYKTGVEKELYKLEGKGFQIKNNIQLKNEEVSNPSDVRNYICYKLQKKTPEKNIDLSRFKTKPYGGIYFRTLREIMSGNQ